jgi:hypothetical protein
MTHQQNLGQVRVEHVGRALGATAFPDSYLYSKDRDRSCAGS